jgi:hypothetical protein
VEGCFDYWINNRTKGATTKKTAFKQQLSVSEIVKFCLKCAFNCYKGNKIPFFSYLVDFFLPRSTTNQYERLVLSTHCYQPELGLPVYPSFSQNSIIPTS